MGQKIIHDHILGRKRSDGGFGDRISWMEDTYVRLEIFEEISSTSGTLSVPTGALIVMDQFAKDVDALCTVIPASGQKPEEELERTAGGNLVAVVLSGVGNADFALSGTPQGSQYAVQYVVDIKFIDLPNVDRDSILAADEVQEPFTVLKFDTTSTHEVSEGEMAYNPDEHTWDMGMGGGVVAQANHETFYPIAVNQTGAHLAEGLLVQFAGTLGASGKILIAPRVADGSAPVEYTMGVITNTGGIPNGGEGHVVWFGKVRGIDTSGTYLSLADAIAEINFQTWSNGDIIYPNSAWDGHFTNIKPTAPHDKSPIAAVIYADENVGTLLVRPHLIPKFIDLSDVCGPATVTGQLPVWNQITGCFDFTYNILDYQLKDDFTEGSVLFRGATEIDEDNSGLHYKKSTGRLGIGTTNPSEKLEVTGSTLPNINIFPTVNTNDDFGLLLSTQTQTTHRAQFTVNMNSGEIKIGNTAGGGFFPTFWSNGNEVMRIDSSGNVGIGTTSPKEKLAVAGNIALSKISGRGLKVGIASPTFGFRDILGDQFSKNTGATKPTLTTYNGAINSWLFGVGDEAYITYHIPHDYVAGTPIFLHIHWSHTSTAVTGGTVTFKATSISSKGHNQGAFGTPSVGTFDGSASPIQYQHVLTEVLYSDGTPTGLQIDTATLEPDTVIELTLEVDANNITVSGGGVPDIFLHYVDVHHQSTNIATKGKAPDFYA